MHLRVLAGGSAETVEAYRPGPFELAVNPVRPGIAHDCLKLTLDPALAAGVERAAAAEGLPTPLWVLLVIESERALLALSRDTGIDAALLEASLNGAAMHPLGALPAQRSRRLVRYALALSDRGPRAVESPRSRVTVAVPHHTFVAWELAAASEGQALPDWATAHLTRLPPQRPLWEAAAAQAGQTLAEWIACQAARRASD
jgi:hypothetical protein